MDRSRLEAFSDGVFAVAITLLVLNLTVAGPGHGKLVHQLGSHWPSFAAYLISFFVIGIIWVNHHALVRSIVVVDRPLLFLNLVLLLWVVLIPFATGLVAEYMSAYLAGTKGGGDVRLAMALYSAVFLGMSAGFASILEWTLHGERVANPVPAERRWAARFRFAGGSLAYVLALIVSLVNAIAAFVIIAVIAVYYIFENTPTSSASSGKPGEPSIPDSPSGNEPRTRGPC
ncbi:MAG: TMEM175 family protein [Streptosporangiaceae bacterium]